jgi:hypothetical protein
MNLRASGIHQRQDRIAGPHHYYLLLAALVALSLTFAQPVHAVSASVAYQPMVSTGLAAGQPFEAWIVLDKSFEPTKPGYGVPAGATMRFTFARAFTPVAKIEPESVLLYGWPQKSIPVKFAIGLDPHDPRTIVITLREAIEAVAPDRPGLKAIHLRTGELNPKQKGNYPIEIQFSNAGELSGRTTAMASITSAPVPVIAAYNQLHDSRNEDWQHVKRGETAALPIDFLVTLPSEARSSISLRPAPNGGLEVLSDNKQIGTIKASGASLMLKDVAFGPGFARLGIVRVQATAGAQTGTAEINAQLTGGPTYTLHMIIEP